MKLHHAPISSNLQTEPPILRHRRVSPPFLRSTANRPSKLPFQTLNRLNSKLSIFSNLPLSKYHTINNTDESRHVFFRSQVGEQTPIHANPIFEKPVKFIFSVYRLLRPFVLYETIIAAFAWAARAFLSKALGQPMRLSILQSLSALFIMACCLGSITGLNQIYDRDIDDINKPFLPISSGDLSVKTAWTLVFAMVTSGLTVAISNGASRLILTLYLLYIIILGVLYSVPPFRWKRYALGAFFAIGSHGAILNAGLYLALKDTVNFPFRWSFQMTFITAFMTLLGVVNGLIKDLSDIEGDRKHDIITPAVVFGPRKTAYMGVGILVSMYVVGMAMSILMPQDFRGSVMVPMHGLFLMYLIFQVRVLEKANYAKEACLKFYMALWHLRYAEYIMFLFM